LIIFCAACKVAGPFGDYPIRFLSIINSVESLDIYQGREPTSVFAAHYLKTNIQDDRNRILEAISNFYEEIDCK
jgi:hypothetical protein